MGSGASFLGGLLGGVGQGLEKRKERGRERQAQQDQFTYNFLSSAIKDPNLRPEEKVKLQNVLSSFIENFGKSGDERKQGMEANRLEGSNILGGLYQPDIMDMSSQPKRDQNVEAMLDQELGPKPTGEVKPALTKRSPYYTPEEKMQLEAKGEGMKAAAVAKAKHPFEKEIKDLQAFHAMERKIADHENRLQVEAVRAGVRVDIANKQKNDLIESIARRNGHMTTALDGTTKAAPTESDRDEAYAMINQRYASITKEKEARTQHYKDLKTRYDDQNAIARQRLQQDYEKFGLTQAYRAWETEIDNKRLARDRAIGIVQQQEALLDKAISEGDEQAANQAKSAIQSYLNEAAKAEREMTEILNRGWQQGNQSPAGLQPRKRQPLGNGSAKSNDPLGIR